MARAKAFSWYKLVAGLVLGATAQPLLCDVVAYAADEPVIAQATARAIPVHSALNKAIELHLQGEYEQADALFNDILTRLPALTAAEQAEFKRYSADNISAIAARHNGGSYLGYAEQYLAEGDTVAAMDLMKKAALTEQYMTAADKQRLEDLTGQLRVVRSAAPQATSGPDIAPTGTDSPAHATDAASATTHAKGPEGVTGAADRELARTKVKLARAQLGQSNFDACEKLLTEAEAVHLTYGKGEDSPVKIRADLAKAKSDPTALLTAARSSLGRKEFDRAEEYAHLSEKANAGSWSLNIWADTPAKVLKDVQTARAEAKADTKTPAKQVAKAPAASETPKSTSGIVQVAAYGDASSSAKGSSPAAEQAPAHVEPSTPAADGGPTVPSPAKPDSSTTAPARSAVDSAATEPAVPNFSKIAQDLLKDGRAALARSNFAQARNCANQAKELKPKLTPGEDTPDKLLADVAKAEAAAKAPKVEKTVADSAAPKASDSRSQRAKALDLVSNGRAALGDGKIDDAMKCAMQAKALNVQWGVFEDTPESLIRDVDKARIQQNQAESIKVLAEGRRLLQQKDFDGAMRAAYRAQTLHGTYYIWDLGDRPETLIADVEAARAKPRRIESKPDVVAKKDDSKPKDDLKPPPAPPPSTENKQPTTVAQAFRPSEGVRQVGATDVKPAPTDVKPVATDVKPATPPGPYFMPGGPVTPPTVSATNTTVDNATKPVTALPAQPTEVAVKPAVDASKATALRLLNEGRKLLLDGDLVSARLKCLEAEKLHVAFSRDEENPAELLQHVSHVAVQRIKGLEMKATDAAGDTKKPEAQRLAEAENDLKLARELAMQFGLDTALIDSRLNTIRLQSNVARNDPKTAGSAPVVVAKNTVPAPADPTRPTGRELLDQARNLLRAGKTAKAREAAEEACQAQYGVQVEAESVLHSIETEEYAQSLMAERKKFAVVVAAYNRRDFANARALLDTVNTKALQPQQLERLKEILETPEMQPTQGSTTVVQVQNQVPAGPGGDNSNLPPPPSGPDVGHAPVSDMNPQESLLKATEAMRVVQFDKLRKMGLTAQNEAMAKFRTGQIEAAIGTLQDFLTTLDGQHLDTNQLAMLKRPIDSRLDQFRLLKEQDAFGKANNPAMQAKVDEHTKHELAIKAKQDRVSELMKQFNNFYRDGKYAEAAQYAQLAHELDPDNGTAAASVTLAERQIAVRDSDATKAEREKFTLAAYRDEEHTGKYTDINHPIYLDKDITAKSRERKPLPQFSPIRDPKVREIYAKLDLPAPPLHFVNTPLTQVVSDLHAYYAAPINFDIDVQGLQNRGISTDVPVSLNVEGISLKSALKIMLRNVGLTFVVRDEVIQITTADRAVGNLQRRTLQVADLIIPITDAPEPLSDFNNWGRNNNAGAAIPATTPAATNGGTPYALHTGAEVSHTGSGMSSASPFASLGGGATSLQGEWNKKKPSLTMEDALINLITTSIEPTSWNQSGGPGTIQYFAPTMSLVINQTIDIQEQIQDLLASLRALQDQEVAIEARFITIADDFYERIGVDFNMNIQTQNQNAKFQTALLSNVFTNQGLINQPTFKGGLISGLTPAGTLTNDLSIPINPNSFNAAVPQFGGYVPGTGGLNIGLAFLSDIQVFLFLEAVAGDVRTNVMTAPKLTLENGQTSTLAVGEGIRNYLTSVSYTVLNSQVVANPVITNIAQNGITLVLQAVISADRRFVRLNPTITLTNVSNTTPTSTIPIQLPLYPTITDFGNGQLPVLFTQYVDAPSVNTIAVNTTVTVPDGGTVLMGGLKIMSEGRNEYGPPILSKIPYINRLFRNTSYGRDSRSLMLMITPRIIIQAEEEDRQTGYSAPRQPTDQ